MSRDLVEPLRTIFRLNEFRGCQQAVIERLINGGHAMLVAPTGSGKSLCYQIPAVACSFPTELTIVISPLIALMQDQVAKLTDLGVDASFVNSSLSAAQRQDRYARLSNNQFRILYVTPERFRKSEFLQAISNRRVTYLAIDEAHCVSQWGHDFRPDYSRIAEIHQVLGRPTTLFVTATATREVREDIILQAGMPRSSVRVFQEGIDRPNLSLNVSQVRGETEKIDAIAEVCHRWSGNGSGIVYTALIKTLEQISTLLRERGIAHRCYHGKLDPLTRKQIHVAFASGNATLILATGAFGMGIDKSNIRFVIHAETPSSIESYYQEIGRAGRDGMPSECLWLYDPDDLLIQMQFISWRNPDRDFFIRVHDFLTERSEQVRAFGLEWLNQQLQRLSKHDHRLETVLALFERYDVIASSSPPGCFDVLSPIPDQLIALDRIQAKLLSDQKKLYALVRFASTAPEDRQAFLRQYFDSIEQLPNSAFSERT